MEAAGVDPERVEESFAASPDGKASSSRRGMVATAFPEATAAGSRMLELGGNAADAACAASLALAVCEPQASGLGGQTIALIHVGGRTVAIDGSSRAPSAAHPSRFAGPGRRFIGNGAATVPSTVATLGYLNEIYGRLDWETLVEPAIRIARRGYRITELQHRCQADNQAKFLEAASRSGAKYFLRDGVAPYDPGDLFVQEDLADTLEHIGVNGYRSFYQGGIADLIDGDMRRNGGLIRKEDLARIPVPVERRAISRRYRGVRICTVPPPGAGGTMLLALMMLDSVPRKDLSDKGPGAYRYLAEVFRGALLSRTQRPFDPLTYPRTPQRSGPSRALARRISGRIISSVGAPPTREPPTSPEDTTHLSVMDGEGNGVSMTQSIELVYGSKTAAEGLGFLYNNYMSAFELENRGHPFYMRPEAAPWSSACPSIIFSGREPWIVAGTPGSERIITTFSLFVSRLLDEGDSIYRAMARPRMHCSTGGRISLETDGAGDKLAGSLREMGYEVDILERRSFYLGAIQAVLKRQTGEGFQGVADIRRDGTAGGIQ